MHCPRDHAPLSQKRRDTHPYDGCEACGGLFLRTGALRHELKHRSVSAERTVILALPVGDVRCPVDDAPMHRLTHRGVEIDVCPTCEGVWLDAHEFDAIVGKPTESSAADKVGTVLDTMNVAHDAAWVASGARSAVGSVVLFVGDALDALFAGLG